MARKLTHPATVAGVVLAVTALTATATAAAAGTAPHASQAPATTTPIKHVVVIIGENHSFDNVFATYQPPHHQKIWNLLSEGIVTKDGTPGPNFSKAAQLTASNTKTYSLNPKITGKYKTLPQPNTTYVAKACDGLNADSPDTRFPAKLPNGPYQNVQHGLSDFVSEAANGTLPAVSFLKPGDNDGHPGYSTMYAWENFVARAIASVQSNPKLWKSTAIFITEDESGGYYDSGYIQPVSFFGDGPRVPMIVVSPFSRQGFVDHTYTDHVSILKFIEANWGLAPLTSDSEDNLPNATPGAYMPKVRPAIGNLMTMFNFQSPHFGTIKLPVRQQPRAVPAARLPVIPLGQR